jgi:DNA-binding transcriptional LysR family regulator
MINKFFALRSLVAVINGGSFVAAAKSMNMTPSAITKTIAGLERELDARLVNRTNRRVTPTEAGQILYEAGITILAELERVESLIPARSDAATGKLRVLLPHSFGRLTVIPRLKRLLDENPGLKLDLHFDDDYVDLINNGFDVAVFVGDIPDSKSITRTLFRGRRVTVASPEYLAQRGEPVVPEDLLSHNCIETKFGKEWTFRAADGSDLRVNINGNIIIRSGDALREAAVSGLGIVNARWYQFREELATGALIRLLPDFETEAPTISVCYAAGRRMPGRIRVFVDFLIEISRVGCNDLAVSELLERSDIVPRGEKRASNRPFQQ